MKIKTYSQSFNSFGFCLSRDCVLSQHEPYESVVYWEPFIAIYWFKRQIILRWRVSITSWLGRRWLLDREVEAFHTSGFQSNPEDP